MTTLPPSNSEEIADPAKAFELFHPKVQKWIWDQGWQQLRPTQARSAAPVLEAEQDVVISAATASGKTEAAWLPICSRLAFDADEGKAQSGIKALYIGPLKALINDQYDRLQLLGAAADLPAYRRHGDVDGGDRAAIVSDPDGILLITPESLEAMFVIQGTLIPSVFNGLRYVVVDELHSFIGTERGAQLQSLLHRIELAIRRRVPRIALSATLADLRIAADFLRPQHGEETVIIDGSGEGGSELQMQLRGYVRSTKAAQAEEDIGTDDGSTAANSDVSAIAEHIYANLRQSDNLVFANSRSNVELYADLLGSMCRERRVPEVFHPHHGSLSKELREDVEKKLKAKDVYATAICTSTLEMGIDIGSADSIGQIGPPGRVASLRQRFGRSGRRGKPAVLRLYITEDDMADAEDVNDQLRGNLFETIATVELMLIDKWYEPPNVAGLHLSTLIQQILSVIAQHGGATAAELFSVLCEEGPFVQVDKSRFVQLLRDLGEREVLQQSAEGTLLAGKVGDKLVNHYSFYTAFQTPEEYRLVAAGRTIGTLPIDFPLVINDFLIFGGKRWRIVNVDESSRVVELAQGAGGKPPLLMGGRGAIADGIRQKMREIYIRDDVPKYLNATAARLLNEGRSAFRRLMPNQEAVIAVDSGVAIVPWRGDLVLNTIMLMLMQRKVEVSHEGISLVCRDTSVESILAVLAEIAAAPPPDPLALASLIKAKERDKQDIYLGESLLTASCAVRDLDVPGAMETIRDICKMGLSSADEIRSGDSVSA